MRALDTKPAEGRKLKLKELQASHDVLSTGKGTAKQELTKQRTAYALLAEGHQSNPVALRKEHEKVAEKLEQSHLCTLEESVRQLVCDTQNASSIAEIDRLEKELELAEAETDGVGRTVGELKIETEDRME
ncbi:hypothetical protein LTR85_008595 [Meristemomyces frigidus]|nr:hypothetical protein LTR85_008595 [Meristemomyces frigidus]